MDATFPDDLMRLADAARLLGVCARTVRRWCGMGRLPLYTVGCRLRVSRADVLSQVRCVPGNSPRPAVRAVPPPSERRAVDVLRKAGFRL